MPEAHISWHLGHGLQWIPRGFSDPGRVSIRVWRTCASRHSIETIDKPLQRYRIPFTRRSQSMQGCVQVW